MTSLSEYLMGDPRFCCVLYTQEQYKDGRTLCIWFGDPYTWDIKNSVFVVYDEIGRPWVTHYDNVFACSLLGRFSEFELICGAYVPHASDGGSYAEELRKLNEDDLRLALEYASC